MLSKGGIARAPGWLGSCRAFHTAPAPRPSTEAMTISETTDTLAALPTSAAWPPMADDLRRGIYAVPAYRPQGLLKAETWIPGGSDPECNLV